eukprot:ctg_1671.g459
MRGGRGGRRCVYARALNVAGSELVEAYWPLVKTWSVPLFRRKRKKFLPTERLVPDAGPRQRRSVSRVGETRRCPPTGAREWRTATAGCPADWVPSGRGEHTRPAVPSSRPSSGRRVDTAFPPFRRMRLMAARSAPLDGVAADAWSPLAKMVAMSMEPNPRPLRRPLPPPSMRNAGHPRWAPCGVAASSESMRQYPRHRPIRRCRPHSRRLHSSRLPCRSQFPALRQTDRHSPPCVPPASHPLPFRPRAAAVRLERTPRASHPAPRAAISPTPTRLAPQTPAATVLAPGHTASGAITAARRPARGALLSPTRSPAAVAVASAYTPSGAARAIRRHTVTDPR